jgi:hypothetical protein
VRMLYTVSARQGASLEIDQKGRLFLCACFLGYQGWNSKAGVQFLGRPRRREAASRISEPTVQVPFMQLPTLVPRYLSEAKEEQSCEES